MTVKLTWTPGSGATSQTVQYRVTGSTSWVTYSTINDNTTSTIQVTLPDDSYDFRILNNCSSCSCPSGYTLVNNRCVLTETATPNVSSNTTQLTRTPYQVYGVDGTRVYTSASLTSSFTILNLSNPFWVRSANPPGWTDPSVYNDAAKQNFDLNNGPVNRLAIWGRTLDANGNVQNNYNLTLASIPPVFQWIGFDVCLNIASSKTYYIAIAGDNQYRFSLNGSIVLETNINTQPTNNFTFLHIYPYTINAGTHTIRVEGYNNGSLAAFGCEIFDLDNRPVGMSVVDYLNAQTDYSNLNVVFTTRGQTQFTSNLYSCPTGYNITNPSCSGVQCVRVTTTACTPNNTSNVATVIPYYYYTGLLCGGSIEVAFRSTVQISSGSIVKALCVVCGNTEQCFDNINPTTTPNTNDIIAVYETCPDCVNNSNPVTTYDCVDGYCVLTPNGIHPDYITCVENCGSNA